MALACWLAARLVERSAKQGAVWAVLQGRGPAAAAAAAMAMRTAATGKAVVPEEGAVAASVSARGAAAVAGVELEAVLAV